MSSKCINKVDFLQMNMKSWHSQILYVLFIFIAVSGGYEAIYGFFVAHSSLGMSGHFDNPAGFAAFLAISLPFVLYFTKQKKKIFVLLGIVIAGIMLVAIVLSRSRAGLLATVIVVVVSLIAEKRAVWRRLTRQTRIIVICVGSMFCLIGCIWLYWYKKDSADGRLLIWRNTIAMSADNPLFGHGTNGFQTKYMLYQARFFESNRENSQVNLADNVKHPFNEYLFLLVRYGIVGFLCITLPFCAFVYYLTRDLSSVNRAILSSFVALGIFSCFSYPLYYPAILILMLFATVIAVIDYYFRHGYLFGFAVASSLWLAGCILLLPYKMPDPLLYNVAVDLNHKGLYEQSISVLTEYCNESMDVQAAMLMANNYFYLEKFEKAEKWAKLAGNMCPGRFIPLYQRFLIYMASGDTVKAKRLGAEIIQKQEKITSYTTKQIKGNVAHKLKGL